MLAQAMTNQINQGAQAPHTPTPASTVRDFMRMNPLDFNGSKVDEDPQEFIDEVYKVLSIRVLDQRRKHSWQPTNSKQWPKYGLPNGKRRKGTIMSSFEKSSRQHFVTSSFL